MNLIPIGYVKRNEGASRHEIVKIVVDKDFSEGLRGLEEFSHLFIIYYMHLSSFKSLTRKCNEKNIGVFSTRSPNRPNPIGISVVELLSIKENILTVKGINAFDGTPVLDIKPYDDWDSIPNPKMPSWYRSCQKYF